MSKKPVFRPAFYLVPARAVEHGGLQGIDLLVLGAVHWYQEMKEGRCIAGNATIGTLLGCHPSTVNNSIARLVEEGFLLRKKLGARTRQLTLTPKCSMRPQAHPKEGVNAPTGALSDAPTGAPSKNPSTKNNTNGVSEEMRKLVKWAEDERGFPFLKGSSGWGKQLRALKLMKAAGITDVGRIKDRWREMAAEPFWKSRGFDFMNVLNSFNRKP